MAPAFGADAEAIAEQFAAAPMAAAAPPEAAWPCPPPVEPAPGSDGGLPSLGSMKHATGQCRPCAFFRTKGCANGLTCKFCHSCEAGERKKRAKAKREAQQLRQQRKRDRRLQNGCGDDH